MYALIIITMVLLQSCMVPVRAKPPWLVPGRVLGETAECHTEDDLLDLCQRCAKFTKSALAYQTCCSSDLTARRWCQDFVYFGQEYHSREFY